jgi:hypothetical protein
MDTQQIKKVELGPTMIATKQQPMLPDSPETEKACFNYY